MKETVIVTTKEDIVKIVQDAFESLISKLNRKEEKEDAPLMLTIEQASKLTGLAIATIYTKTSNKQIPHHKKGKKLYFLKTELQQWLFEGNRVKTSSELESQAATYCLGKSVNK